jgi:hypothetical protein
VSDDIRDQIGQRDRQVDRGEHAEELHPLRHAPDEVTSLAIFSRAYNEIVHSRMTFDDLIRLNGGRMR